MGLLSEMSADEIRELERANKTVNDNSGPPEKTLMQKLGAGLKDRFTDPTFYAGLASAFNQVGSNPSAAMQQRYSMMLEADRQREQGNQTVAFLRSKNQDKLADAIEANPSMAADIMKQYTAGQVPTAYSKKAVGSVQQDPITGQKYIINYDANTGVAKRQNLEGAMGMTAAEKMLLEQQQAATLRDEEKAFEASSEMSQGISGTREMMGTMIDMRRLLDGQDEVRLGFFNNLAPTTRAATARFESMANKLGIQVINSATFGALSEKELKLALDTAVPRDLGAAEMREFLDSKIAAQEKLLTELMRKQDDLNSLGSFKAFQTKENELMRENLKASRSYPKDDPLMTQSIWRSMSPNQQKEYLKRGEQ